MPIIREMIYYRKIRRIFLTFYDDDPEAQYFLEQIGPTEWEDHEEREEIPVQVIEVLCTWGITLVTSQPKPAMSRENFLEALWHLHKSCPDYLTRDAALFLFSDTVRYLMPWWPQDRKNSSKCRGKKRFQGLSSGMPGTIS